MQWIAQYIARPEFRGCAFLDAATEFHDAGQELADQLVLLIDGGYINSQLHGKRRPVKVLPKAAAALIEAAME